MVDIDDAAIEELVHEGRSMGREDVFEIIERSYDDRPGVPVDALEAYVRALASRRDYSFDAESFLTVVDERRTDAESWGGPDRFYELGDDRLSQYPAEWHDRLGGSTDAVAYVEFIEDEAPEFAGHHERDGPDEGVAKGALIDVIRTVGHVDRETATEAVERARADGDVVEDADQHPNAGVYVTDEGESGDSA